MTNTLIKLCIPALTLILGACASTDGKFSSHKVIDLTAFADNTLVIMQTPAGALTASDAILSEAYVRQNMDKVHRMEELTSKVESLFSHIKDYSIAVSGISIREMDEAGRVASVANALQVFSDDVSHMDAATQDSFANTIVVVRTQDKFLVAVRRAQPAINIVGRMAQGYLNEYDKLLLQVADSMSAALNEDFDPIANYLRRVDSRNRALVTKLMAVYEREQGLGALAAEEEKLIQAFERNHRLAEEVGPEWTLYVDTAAEIDRLQEVGLANTTRARVAMLTWVRAHEKMASGEERPADWFSLKDVSTAAFMAGRSML